MKANGKLTVATPSVTITSTSNKTYEVKLFTPKELRQITKILSKKYSRLEVFVKKYLFSEDDFCDVLACERNDNATLILEALKKEGVLESEHVIKYWGSVGAMMAKKEKSNAK